MLRPTAESARTGDPAEAIAPVRTLLEIPDGMRIADVELLDARGAELAVSVPEDGVVRFDGPRAGTYRRAFTTTTDTVGATGATEISAMTIGLSGPVVLEAPGSIVAGG